MTENKYPNKTKTLEIKMWGASFIVTWYPKYIDAKPAEIVIKSAVINVISTLLDLVARDFVAMSLIVKNIAEIIGSINMKLKSKSWGLITTTTPTNPIRTAVHLLTPTFSFKKRKANIVTKNGLVISNV